MLVPKAAKGSKPVAKLTKPVKRAVNAMINRKIETKYVAEYRTNEDATPVSIYGDVWPQGTPNGNVQLYLALPNVSEGATDYTRTGDQINPTKLSTDIDLKFNTGAALSGNTDTCAWDVTAHIWYGFCRRYKNNDDINANQVAIVQNMMEVGNGQTIRFLGGPVSDQFSLNKEFVLLKHKKVRMYRPLGTQNTATTAGGVTTYYPQIINKKMRLSWKVPKVFKYNEQSSWPENYAPFIIIGYQHNDGTQAANAFTTNPFTLPTQVPALQAVIRSHLWYKDA